MWETLHEVGREVWGGLTTFFSGMIGAAVVGRLAWHTRLVQKGERRLFGPEFFYESPVVGLAGWFGVALGDFFHLSQTVTGGVCAVAGYYGPGGVQAALAAYAKWKGVDVDLTPKDDAQ